MSFVALPDHLKKIQLTINPLPHKEGWVLKKLTDKHKTIIALHVQNMKRIDIAEVAGCTPEYVSMIVAQPLAQAYLKQIEEYTDARLSALYGKSVDAIEKGLDAGDEEIALKAARLQLEATGKFGKTEKGNQTAEDVVAQLLKHAHTVILGQNVQVNQGN